MKLTRENYYSLEADRKYMSVSQLKSFMECEARTMAELNGDIPKISKQSFLEGSYLHAWCEGKLEEFQKDNLEIYKYNNPKKGLMSNFQKIDKVIKYLETDENVLEMLEGEKEVIMTANLFDVDWKFRIDVYNPSKGRLVDLKYVNKINQKFWNNSKSMHVSFVEHYKYHYQMVLYAILEQLATNRENILEPYIVAISKEIPPQKVILDGFLEDINTVLDDVSKRLPRIIKVKNGEEKPNFCGKCDYCRSILKAKTINYKYLIREVC